MFASKLLLVLLACLTIHLASANRTINIWVNQRTTTTTKDHISITQHTTPTTATARPIRTLPSGYVHFSDIKTSFKIHDDRVNWYTAREMCIAEGANLAVIDTWLKLRHVVNMMYWLDYVWTGISRTSLTSNWRAVHGGPLSWPLPWSNFNKGYFGNCVGVSGLSTALGSWMCVRRKQYICEIPDASL